MVENPLTLAGAASIILSLIVFIRNMYEARLKEQKEWYTNQIAELQDQVDEWKSIAKPSLKIAEHLVPEEDEKGHARRRVAIRSNPPTVTRSKRE